jgi:rare lipoprotein A
VRALIVLVVLAAACTPKPPPRQPTAVAPVKKRPTSAGVQEGLASWYGGKLHGGPTASGERFNKHAMTAAHRTLKMGTRVRVIRKKNGRSVIVRINDRGPYGRAIIDLSEAAARQLDMIDDGIAKVRIEVVK